MFFSCGPLRFEDEQFLNGQVSNLQNEGAKPISRLHRFRIQVFISFLQVRYGYTLIGWL